FRVLDDLRRSLLSYTTLFRSGLFALLAEDNQLAKKWMLQAVRGKGVHLARPWYWLWELGLHLNDQPLQKKAARALEKDYFFSFRSEEHTSELQSREKLVCRLL